MRLLILIILMISMAVAPAAALGSCASMADGGHIAADAPTAGDGGMEMSGMPGKDCDGMEDELSPFHDAGCAAACALACPGFFAGPDQAASTISIFRIDRHPIPATSAMIAAPSHLDPPPPRV